jgi:hypothetical protein
MKTRRIPNRRGYALVMVAVFCVLFATFMGVAWRRMASTIRTFSVRSNQVGQDQGAIMALADAMRALEVGPPPTTTYTCYCVETVSVMQNLRIKYPETDKTRYPETTKTCYYRLTFERQLSEESSSGDNRVYTVAVEKLEQKPADGTFLDINDFGVNGPLGTP